MPALSDIATVDVRIDEEHDVNKQRQYLDEVEAFTEMIDAKSWQSHLSVCKVRGLTEIEMAIVEGRQ